MKDKKIFKLLILFYLIFSTSLTYPKISKGNEQTIEKRLNEISNNVRCLVCRNQSIYDSNSDFANDMKKIIIIHLKENKSDEFIFNRSNQFGHTKADLITQFSVADCDSIQLDTNAFPGLTQLRFKAVSTLQAFNRQLEQNSSVIYFEPFGELYFDQNGRQPGQACR